ncbi:DUF2797 domain-containing protein [Pedobacter hartonius]|uniref:DUF2797 domain-containing protein n=1 Tax=Pedobacter hartonius TaxID=425514 RepID=A0A1H3ZIT7_9SPHI|nr:DUF2797 domain-containing protein [Pedobacter hartonius]SEA23498.1 Protein of unknown function [Pedobacter hartonius]
MENIIKILSGYGFNSAGPHFIIDEINGKLVKRNHVNIIGHTFTIKPSSLKFCIGRYDLRTSDSFPCPHVNPMTNKKESICYDCFTFNSFNPSFYNVSVSELSIKQREYNMLPHNVYLALFDEHHIKVGISQKKRNLTRWLEQGARVATVIFECNNAYLAREIEEKISKELKLSEALRNDQKRQCLKNKSDFNKASTILEGLITKINALFEQQIIHQSFTKLDEYYLQNNVIQANILDISNEMPESISGKGIGLIGDTLVFENSHQQFMFSLKKIIGQQILFENKLTSQAFSPTQISLF